MPRPTGHHRRELGMSMCMVVVLVAALVNEITFLNDTGFDFEV